MDWTDEYSPRGLVKADGTQVTERIGDFIGYADDFARQANDNSKAARTAAEAALAAVQALAAKVAAGIAPAPQIDLDALAAKVAAHIHLSGNVVAQGDQPTS